MSGWWRRNTIPLVAVAVLAPLAVGVIGASEWTDYFGSRPAIPVEAPASGPIELGDASWGPLRAKALDPATFPAKAPANTRIIAVQLPVAPHRAGVGCLGIALVEQSSGRTWTQMREELGLRWSKDEPTSCDSARDEAYSLFVPFIVPADAQGPFWLDVPVTSALPRFARIPVVL